MSHVCRIPSGPPPPGLLPEPECFPNWSRHRPRSIRSTYVTARSWMSMRTSWSPAQCPVGSGSRTYNSRVTGSAALGGSWVGNFLDYRLVSEAGRERGPDRGRHVQAGLHATADGATRVRPTARSPWNATGPTAQFVLTNWATGEVISFPRLLGHPSRSPQGEDDAGLAGRRPGRGALHVHGESHQVTQITTAEGQDYNVVFTTPATGSPRSKCGPARKRSTRIREVDLHVLRLPVALGRMWARTATWCR